MSSKILLLLALSAQSVNIDLDRTAIPPQQVIYPVDVRHGWREWLINDTQNKKLRVVADTRQGLCWGEWFNPRPLDGHEWAAYLDTSEFPSKLILQSDERYREVAIDIPAQCQP